MALHHRKLLFAEPQKTPEFDKGFSSSCYMCYVCPKNCYISPPPPQLSHLDDIPEKDHVSTVVIMMLCILGVAFLVLSYLTIARYRCRRRNSESLEASRAEFLDENHGPVLDHPIWYIRTVGLPQSVIDSIALFPYKAGDGLIDGHDCSVCLNDFQENESLRLLPKCSHAFHVGCIDTWLRSHMTCPVCRAPILVGNANNPRVSPVESSPTSSESNQGENRLENHGGSETGESGETRMATMLVQEDPTAKISSKNRLRVLSDLADHRVEIDDRELQRVRRSVSMDFSMATMIYPKGEEGCSNTKLEIIGIQNSEERDCNKCSICRVMKSSSYVESLQKGPVSMKRSFSRSLRKNNRSLESIQIPEISLEN